MDFGRKIHIWRMQILAGSVTSPVKELNEETKHHDMLWYAKIKHAFNNNNNNNNNNVTYIAQIRQGRKCATTSVSQELTEARLAWQTTSK